AVVRAEAQVKGPVEQQQAGPVFLVLAVEDGDVSFITRAGGGDQNGAARLLVAGSDVEGMKMVANCGVEKSLRHQIHGVGGGIDDWSRGNAFLGKPGTVPAGEIYAAGRRAPVEHAGVPELCAGV